MYYCSAQDLAVCSAKSSLDRWSMMDESKIIVQECDALYKSVLLSQSQQWKITLSLRQSNVYTGNALKNQSPHRA
jgi:hypothetical protein